MRLPPYATNAASPNDMESLGAGPLVPLLRPGEDPADPVTLLTWYEALSSALSADVPHDLFAFWIYPASGGAVLLAPEAQALVIGKVARVLEPKGRFLFTAPREPLEWLDGMTDQRSYSLGEHAYARLLRAAGLTWAAAAQDEGDNHYYFVEKV